MFTSYLQLN